MIRSRKPFSKIKRKKKYTKRSLNVSHCFLLAKQEYIALDWLVSKILKKY